jgi:DNA sulfur modification protein DndB
MIEPAFEYIFPAIRGVQAGTEYYVSMCPLKLLPRIFRFDDDDLSPELRAQRTLNISRIPEITHYIVENRHSYVFSAITASIDGEVRFDPMGQSAETSRIGALHIDLDAQFIINDGQHRRAAIEAALKEDPTLGDESISVVFFLDQGLARSQQMFTDLNLHQIKASKSMSLTYDHRDKGAAIARGVAAKSKAFKNIVDMEQNKLGKRSRKLFTLSAIHMATLALFKDWQSMDTNQAIKIACQFWNEVDALIPEWRLVRSSKLTSGEVREDFVHSHAVTLHALGSVGRALLEQGLDVKQTLAPLSTLDWSRQNGENWEGRALIAGRIQKTSNTTLLTANFIKQRLGIALSATEEQAEISFRKGKS